MFYIGEIIGGNQHGCGTCIAADGSMHNGEFKDGKAPAGAKLFTAADLQQIEREGWDVFTIQYVDFSQGNQQGHKLW